MKGDRIPDSDHVVRHCSGRSVDGGHVMALAFELKEHEYLSVNWLEYFGVISREAQVDAVWHELQNYLTLRKSGRLAVLNVGDARAVIESELSLKLTVSHEPEDDDGRPMGESHCGIYGYTDSDPFVAVLLAGLVLALHPTVLAS